MSICVYSLSKEATVFDLISTQYTHFDILNFLNYTTVPIETERNITNLNHFIIQYGEQNKHSMEVDVAPALGKIT